MRRNWLVLVLVAIAVEELLAEAHRQLVVLRQEALHHELAAIVPPATLLATSVVGLDALHLLLGTLRLRLRRLHLRLGLRRLHASIGDHFVDRLDELRSVALALLAVSPLVLRQLHRSRPAALAIGAAVMAKTIGSISNRSSTITLETL